VVPLVKELLREEEEKAQNRQRKKGLWHKGYIL